MITFYLSITFIVLAIVFVTYERIRYNMYVKKIDFEDIYDITQNKYVVNKDTNSVK